MYEWDDAKNRSNQHKHGLPFELTVVLFDGPTLEWEDSRIYDEERWIAVGEVNGRVVVCVYTWREDRRRIISLRRATKSETRDYYESIC